jgi:hypothetical protein
MVPTSKEPLAGAFTKLVWWGHRTSPVELSGCWSRPNKSGRPTSPVKTGQVWSYACRSPYWVSRSRFQIGQVQWGSLEVGQSSMEADHGPNKSCFVPCNNFMFILFVTEHSFGSHNILL